MCFHLNGPWFDGKAEDQQRGYKDLKLSRDTI